MRVRLAIGDFAKMTHLSIKALRHYHDLGLLEPAEVDSATGYRFYHPGQVRTAQIIRRLRDLGMPLDKIRAVLAATDVPARNEVMAAHLRRMECQLSATQSIVDSLRSLLDLPPGLCAGGDRRVSTHATVLMPLVADLAPAGLRGRYMAAMGLSWWAGLAVAPALGAQLLAVSGTATFAV